MSDSLSPEEMFGMDAQTLMRVLASRSRLLVAVRGGVAEYHLMAKLRQDPSVVSAQEIDLDGQPDAEVELSPSATALAGQSTILVECKNASPRCYADGTPKVEFQKTRASKSDPLSRFYRTDQFQVAAVCVQPVSGEWEFLYRRSELLARHAEHPDRIAPLQRVEGWHPTLAEALAESV